MKLNDAFKTIIAVLSKPLSSIKAATVSEESLVAQIEDIRESLIMCDVALGSLSEKHFNTMYTKVVERLKFEPLIVKAIGKDVTNVILSIDKELKGKAKSLGLYKALMLSNKNSIAMLDKLKDQLPMILGDKHGISIIDLQISHSVVIGAIESSNVYATVQMYLVAILGALLNMPTMGDATIPKYIAEYFVKKFNVFLSVIDQQCNTPDTLILSITNLKKHGLDLKFTNGIKSNFVLEIPAIAVAIGKVLPYVVLFAAAVMSYPLMAESYVELRHAYYERLKDRKKWLEGYVAQIKMSLEDVDPNDPEYVKWQKIIAYYTDKIAELDKKIQSYYNE